MEFTLVAKKTIIASTFHNLNTQLNMPSAWCCQTEDVAAKNYPNLTDTRVDNPETLENEWMLHLDVNLFAT